MGEDELGMDLFDSLDLDGLDVGEFEDQINERKELSGDNDEPTETKEEKEKEKEDTSEGDDNPDTVAGTEGTDDSKEESEEQEDENASPNLYKSLATVLFENGVIPSVESSELEKAKSVDDIVEIVKKQVKANEFSSLNKIQKEYLESLESGLPTERFDAYKRAEDNLNNITEDAITKDENLRKQLIFRDFKARGYNDDKALKMTQRSFDSDEDLEDAKAAYEVLKTNLEKSKAEEIEKIKNDKKALEEKVEKDKKELQKTIFDTDEIIKGYKINEGLKKQIHSKIMNPVSTNPETGKQENALMKFQRENPKDFMHKLYYLFTVTKDFSDFSYFQNKSRTDSVKELENAMRTNTHVSSGGDPSFLDDPNSFSVDIGDELVLD